MGATDWLKKLKSITQQRSHGGLSGPNLEPSEAYERGPFWALYKSILVGRVVRCDGYTGVVRFPLWNDPDNKLHPMWSLKLDGKSELVQVSEAELREKWLTDIFVDDPLWVPLKILELQAANWADTSGLLPSQGSRAVASLTVQPSSYPAASPQGDPAPAPGRLRMAQTPVDPTPSAQDRVSEEASAAEPEAAPEPALNQEAGGSRQVPCSAQGLGPRVQPGPLPIEEPDQQLGQEADQQPGQEADQQPGQEADQQPGQEADQQPGQEADQQPGQEADQGQEEEAEAPPTPGTEVLEEPGAAEGPQAGGELSSDLGGLGHLPGREEHVARQQASASPSCQDTEPVADLGSAGSGSSRSPSPPVPLPGSLPLPAELPPPLPTTLQYPAGGPRPQSGAAGPPCGASIPTNPSEPDTAADSAAPNPPAPNSPAPNPPAPNSPAPTPPAPNPPAPNPSGGGMVPGAAAPTVAAPGLGSAPKRDQTARLGTVVPGAGFRSVTIQPPAGKSKAGPPAPGAAARVQPLLAPHPPKAFVATSAKLVPVALARPGAVEVGSGAVGAKRPSTDIAAGEGRGPALKDGITPEVEPACVADGRVGACRGLGASAATSGKAAALAAIQAAREAAEARARAAATSDPRHAPPIEQLGNAKVQSGKAVRASHAEPITTQPAAYIHPNPYPSAAQPLPHSSVQHGHASQLAEESDEATVTVTADDNEAASLEQGWHESRWHHVQGGGHVPAPPPPLPHTTSLQSSAVQHNARKSATARGRKGAKARGRHLVLDTSSDEANSDTEHRGVTRKSPKGASHRNAKARMVGLTAAGEGRSTPRSSSNPQATGPSRNSKLKRRNEAEEGWVQSWTGRRYPLALVRCPGDMEDDGSEGAGEYFVDCIVDEWCTAEGEIWVLLKWTNYVLKFGDGPECLYNGDKGHWEPLREAFEDGARNKMYKAWKARKPGWYANQAAATHHVGSSDGEEDSHLGKTSAKKQRLSLGAARVK